MTKILPLILALTFSCSHLQNKSSNKEQAPLLKMMEENAQKESEGLTPTEKMSSLEIQSNLKVQTEKWIQFFTGSYKKTFERFLSNGEPYRALIESILDEHLLPRELYFLPVIESGYQLQAKSRVGAHGTWQFMPATAKSYGLVINRHVDERRDVHKATQAAAAHLRDLYNIFGSWELALSAYNAGINRIMGTIIKGSNREYWKLRTLGVFPKETAEYVPKFLAAVIVGSQPEKYGLQIQKASVDYLKDITTTPVKGGVSLEKIARATGVQVSELKKWNPELTNNSTPPHTSIYDLKLEKENLAAFNNGQNNLRKIAKVVENNKSAMSEITYRVQAGDSIYSIAKKFGLSEQSLLLNNHIKNNEKIFVGQKLVINQNYSGIYIVKRGDNLSEISNRFKISINQIKSINGLRSKAIYPGQRLRVSAGDGVYYVVKSGDTLIDIAKSRGLSIEKIMKLNSLNSTDIHIGQELVLSVID